MRFPGSLVPTPLETPMYTCHRFAYPHRNRASLSTKTVLLIALFASLVPGDSSALARNVTKEITVRRAMGVTFLVGGALLAQKGFDYRDEADAFYSGYKTAVDEEEIERFYQRTTNRDVKSQVSWALAAALGVNGVRLLLTGGTDDKLTDRVGGSAQHRAAAPSPAQGFARYLRLNPRSKRVGEIGIELTVPFHMND